MSYELFEMGPAVYLPLILLSLAITLVIYAAFPLLFAKLKTEPIGKKAYTRTCHIVNFVIMILYKVLMSSSSFSIMPYLLWTGVFSSSGVDILKKKGLLIDPLAPDYSKTAVGCDAEETTLVEESIVEDAPADEALNDISFTEEPPAIIEADPPALQPAFEPVLAQDEQPPQPKKMPPIKFCRKCGYSLLEGSLFCSRCGTKIIEEENK